MQVSRDDILEVMKRYDIIDDVSPLRSHGDSSINSIISIPVQEADGNA